MLYVMLGIAICALIVGQFVHNDDDDPGAGWGCAGSDYWRWQSCPFGWW